MGHCAAGQSICLLADLDRSGLVVAGAVITFEIRRHPYPPLPGRLRGVGVR